jgi:Fis family transcriptional regulator
MSTDIADAVRRTLNRYFRELDGEMPHPIYPLVLASAERPMLEMVMGHAQGNQSLAAQMLGINRNTLRKKLAEYQLL